MSNDHTPPILTVSQATVAIKQLLESRFRQLILQGEVSNFKRQSSGHLYFTLKDHFSQISAVMFRSQAMLLSPLPKEGDQVIVHGEISVYEPRGSYQIIVRQLSYTGIGALLLQLEKLKGELQKRGWFDTAHKKPLPPFPARIGVITSPTGAVIQDILQVLQRRHAGFHLILNPVKVQGEGAAQEIALAIQQMNQHDLADVLIVGRGGGSFEDLFAFNEEVVARAIFHSHIPVIAAVGHESDISIADLVADVRAPTPSAAAEIVMAEKNQLLHYLKQCQTQFKRLLSHQIQQRRSHLAGVLRLPLLNSTYAFLSRYYLLLDEKRQDLTQGMHYLLHTQKLLLKSVESQIKNLQPLNQIRHLAQKRHTLARALDTFWRSYRSEKQHMLHALTYRLDQAWRLIALQKRQRFETLNFPQQLDAAWERARSQRQQKLLFLLQHLQALDPRFILKKGYSILFAKKEKTLIMSTRQMEPGDLIFAQLQDGQVELEVKQIR